MLLEDQLTDLIFKNTCERYRQIRETIDSEVEARPLTIKRADDETITTETYFRMNHINLRIGEKIQGDSYDIHKDGSLTVIAIHENLGPFIGNGTLNITVTDRKGDRPYISEFETQFSCRPDLNDASPTIIEIESKLASDKKYCVEEHEDEYGPLYRIKTKTEAIEVVADTLTESAGHILHTHNLCAPLPSIHNSDAKNTLHLFRAFVRAYQSAAN